MSDLEKMHAQQAGLTYHLGQAVLDTITGEDATITRAVWQRDGGQIYELYEVTLKDGTRGNRKPGELVLY